MRPTGRLVQAPLTVLLPRDLGRHVRDALRKIFRAVPPEVKWRAITTLFFLRLVSPVIIDPHAFGLTLSVPEGPARRTCVDPEAASCQIVVTPLMIIPSAVVSSFSQRQYRRSRTAASRTSNQRCVSAVRPGVGAVCLPLSDVVPLPA